MHFSLRWHLNLFGSIIGLFALDEYQMTEKPLVVRSRLGMSSFHSLRKASFTEQLNQTLFDQIKHFQPRRFFLQIFVSTCRALCSTFFYLNLDDNLRNLNLYLLSLLNSCLTIHLAVLTHELVEKNANNTCHFFYHHSR